MAALGTTNITTTLVANTLGVGSNDIGTLCSSDKINPFSIHKPLRTYLGVSDVTGFHKTVNGSVNSAGIIKYQSPGIVPTREYRLGDFRQYDHDTLKPIFDPLTVEYTTDNLFNPNLPNTINGINAKNLSYLENIGTELFTMPNCYFVILRDNLGSNTKKLVRCSAITGINTITFEDVLEDITFRTSWQAAVLRYKFYLTSEDNRTSQDITISNLTNYYEIQTEGNLNVTKMYVNQAGTAASVRSISADANFTLEEQLFIANAAYVTTSNYLSGKTLFHFFISFATDPTTDPSVPNLHDRLINIVWNQNMPSGGSGVDRISILQANGGNNVDLSIKEILFVENGASLNVPLTTFSLPYCYRFSIELNSPISFVQNPDDFNVGILQVTFKGANP